MILGDRGGRLRSKKDPKQGDVISEQPLRHIFSTASMTLSGKENVSCFTKYNFFNRSIEDLFFQSFKNTLIVLLFEYLSGMQRHLKIQQLS